MRSAAAIVTFNPDEAVRSRIDNIAAQVDVLYVLDNSASPTHFGELSPSVTYIHHQNVGGLAGALNRALRLARADQFERLFVFDQDTDVAADFCESLASAADQGAWGRAAVVGPMHVNSSTGHPVRLSVSRGLLMSHWPSAGDDDVDCMFLINSCSLLNLSLIPQDVEYDESLLVDMTDVDFCLRLRRRGLRSTCIPRVQVRHGIGERKSGSAKFSATNYSAHRKYLQTRGRVIVWRRNVAECPRWVASDFLIATMDFARTVVFEKNRLSKLKAFATGFVDGFRAPVAL